MSNPAIHRGDLAWPAVETRHCRQANAQRLHSGYRVNSRSGLSWTPREHVNGSVRMGRLLPGIKAHPSGADNFDESL
jgi:hypothetical protein